MLVSEIPTYQAPWVNTTASLRTDPLTTPLAAVMNAIYVWRALFMRRTEWSGVTYEIAGPTRTKVLSRTGVA